MTDQGFTVIQNAVHPDDVDAALRLINREIRLSGIHPETADDCLRTTYFPHLRGVFLDWWQCSDLGTLHRHYQLAEPQILLRFPEDPSDEPLVPHIDEPPPWAKGRQYKAIVGVALSDCGPRDGALHVWPGSHLSIEQQMRRTAFSGGDEWGAPWSDYKVGPPKPEPVCLNAGDAVVMHPNLAHAGSLNLGPKIRYAVYFRFLEPSKEEAA